jgi:hypothetical protein
MDQLFTTRGEVLPAGPETLQTLGLDASIFGDSLEDVGDLFDDESSTGPAGPPDEATAPVRVTAEWLEVEIRVPDAPTVVQRRTVFDLLGSEARAQQPVPAPTVGPAERLQRALGLMREVDVLVTGAALNADFVRHALVRDGAKLLRVVAPLLRSPSVTIPSFDEVPRIPLPLYRHALLRLPSAADGGDARAYPDRPNVVLAWSGFSGTGAADLEAQLLFDIVANDLAVPAAADGGFAGRIAQGVRDTVTEDELAGPGVTGNAAALYEADRAAGRAWVRIDPADAAAVGGLDLPPAARDAIAADLAAGAIVLAPPAPVATPEGPRVAWWRIDPRTGTTLGLTTAGGAAMSEYALQIWHGFTIAGCFTLMGIAIARQDAAMYGGAAMCVAGGVTAGVGAAAGATGGFLLGTAGQMAGLGAVTAALATQ